MCSPGTGYNSPVPLLDAPRPPIVVQVIPFRERRRRETAAYARRHYGLDTWRLRRPRVIVEHLTANPRRRRRLRALGPCP